MDGILEPSFLDISTTYVNWKSEFSQILLASNGFKYTGDSDIVQCVSCGIKLQDLKEGDNIQERHFKVSPNCKYCKVYGNQATPSLSDIPQRSALREDFSDNCYSPRNMDSNPKEVRSQFVPNRSENRLPVPVNIISDNLRGSGHTFRFNPNRAVEQSDCEVITNINNQDARPATPIAQMAKYQEESARLASFDNWPDNAHVKPPGLARAGLFYTGLGDKVKCPFCLGSMYNWEKDDVPLSEHSKHYPKCAFVKYHLFQSLFTSDLSAQRVVSDAVPSPPLDNNTGSASTAVAAGGKDGKLEDNATVKIVHEMGFDMDMIREAIQRMSDVKLCDVKAAALIDALYAMEDEELSEPITNTAGKSSPESHSLLITGGDNKEEPLLAIAPVAKPAACRHSVDEPEGNGQFACGNNNTDSPAFEIAKDPHSEQPQRPLDPKYRKLTDEHNKLTKKKVCNICGDEEVSVLFLPCRHLIACETCSADMKDCAQCDKLIIGTVKIFFP